MKKRRNSMAQRALIISDFDGTLARIRRDPKKVKLSQEMFRLLCKLRDANNKIVVVSARPKKFLQKVLPNGIEMIGSRGNTKGLTNKGIIKKIQKALQSVKKQYPGIQITVSACGVDVHYRNYRNINEEALAQCIQTTVKALKVRIVKGRKVVEIMPRTMSDKQEIVKKIARNWTGFLVFLGDDESDAHAAKEVIKRKKGKAFLLKTKERNISPHGIMLLSGMKDVHRLLVRVLISKET